MSPRPRLFLNMGNGRTAAPYTSVAKTKSKEREKKRKGRSGRSMSTNLASAEQPSDQGSTGPKWADEEQHWVPLFNTISLRQRMCRRQCQEHDVVRCLESLNWLAGRRDQSLEHECTRPGATQFHFKQEVLTRVRKLVHERCSRASAVPLPQAAFRELLGSHSVYGPDENGNLANLSTVELVSLPGSLSGCPRLCDVLRRTCRA